MSKVRLWSPYLGISVRDLIFRDLQKLSSLGAGVSFSIGVMFTWGAKIHSGCKARVSGLKQGSDPIPTAIQGQTRIDGSQNCIRPQTHRGLMALANRICPVSAKGSIRHSYFSRARLVSASPSAPSSIRDSLTAAKYLLQTPFRRLLFIFRTALSSQGSDAYHYIERGNGGRKKTHSYYFYFFAYDVVANFSHVPPSAHTGSLPCMKRYDIVPYKSQDKEKHSSEVCLWNIEAVKPSLEHVNV